MIRLLTLLFLSLALALFLPATARSNVEATYILGLPQVSGTIADYPITLEYSADDGNEVVFFGIDVESSASELTSSGTDYSAFSFGQSLPLLANWTRIADFGPSPLKSVTQFDTLTDPLVSGAYPLGTLSVDFSGTAITPGTIGAVTIDAPDSVIGVELPGDKPSFQFIDVDVIVLPEPTAGMLALFGLFGSLFLRRVRRA